MTRASTPFEFEIKPISRQFEFDHFDCDAPALNEYLQKYARQNHDRNISKTFVAIEKDGSKKILGFYTAVASEIEAQAVPQVHSKHLPRYPVPIIRIGRLAVDKSYKGKRIGEGLLIDALGRAKHLSLDAGIYAVAVDAKDETAARFYHKYGFIPLSQNPNSLFLPISTIQNLFSKK